MEATSKISNKKKDEDNEKVIKGLGNEQGKSKQGFS